MGGWTVKVFSPTLSESVFDVKGQDYQLLTNLLGSVKSLNFLKGFGDYTRRDRLTSLGRGTPGHGTRGVVVDVVGQRQKGEGWGSTSYPVRESNVPYLDSLLGLEPGTSLETGECQGGPSGTHTPNPRLTSSSSGSFLGGTEKRKGHTEKGSFYTQDHRSQGPSTA